MSELKQRENKTAKNRKKERQRNEPVPNYTQTADSDLPSAIPGHSQYSAAQVETELWQTDTDYWQWHTTPVPSSW